MKILRAALVRSGYELRMQLASPLLVSWIMMPAITLAVLYAMRKTTLPGGEYTIGQTGISGVLTLHLVTSAILGTSSQLMMASEDGTLLRARLVPGAIKAHLLAEIITALCMASLGTALLAGVSIAILPGVAPPGGHGAITLAWLLPLSVACLSAIGALLGSVIRRTELMWLVGLGVFALLGISGVFYPLSAFPTWLQHTGQVFPVYWIGHGFRSAFLPDGASAVELDGSWQLGSVAIVLALWTVLSLCVAAPLVKRLARNQSGAAVSEARERVLGRGY